MNNARNALIHVARLGADEAAARRIADRLGEFLSPGEAACTAFAEPDGRWQVVMHFRAPPDEAALRALVALAGGPAAAQAMRLETLSPRDWVTESLAGLSIVPAGRFVVHGAHDRERLRGRRVAVEIEAALAFGTGHHGTTRGCLLALDRLARTRPPGRILDLGTGSGVLAIAAAKLWRRRVLAIDIDRQAVAIAAANARANGVGPLLEVLCANGLTAPQVAARRQFDLVLANILLTPLTRLAAPLARQLAPNARVVLSGLLAAQGAAALAAYRGQGLVLERRIVLDGWVTLTLIARRSRPRPTPRRSGGFSVPGAVSRPR